MYDSSDIIDKLATLIDKKRIKHSIGVSNSAAELAEHYGVDISKARLAGMLHDCAKCLSYEDMLTRCNKYELKLDNISIKYKALIHGPLGALIASDIFHINDCEILDAIACHTTGKKGMTLFDKVICLADYIEPDRQFLGIDEIREYAFKDINKALLKALELSLRHVLDRGKLLHMGTVEARNELLMEIDGRCDMIGARD